ncbi:MAG: hypothetical protein AMXMBFR82_25260 [Candidatus Hydrogenedentota bacterium]
MLPEQLCDILAQIFGALAGIPVIGGVFERLLGILDEFCPPEEEAAG